MAELLRYTTQSDEETVALGRELARTVLSKAGVVLLIGNLGAGKTTLAKGIVEGRGVGAADEVASPTFTLIHEYGDPPRVYHIDLYRLDEPRQVAALGIEELIDRGNALVLIEWGERFPHLWPADRTEIRIERTRDGGSGGGGAGDSPGQRSFEIRSANAS